MKLNNKGFAISAIIYSTLILFLLVLASFLAVLSSKKNQLSKTMESSKSSLVYENIAINKKIGTNDYYITPYRGKYKITTSLGTGYILLPKNVVITASNGLIKFDNSVIITLNDSSTHDKYKFLEITDEVSTDIYVMYVETNKTIYNE